MKNAWCVLFALGALGCGKGSNKSSNPEASVDQNEASAKPEPVTCDLEKLSFRLNSKGKVVAIGDIHGDLSALKETLAKTDLVDQSGAWKGGTAYLVQTGDVLDRGDDEPDIWSYLDGLQAQAASAGGKVVLLNGNHEYMNVMGDFRYVTKDGFKDFSDASGTGLANADDVPEFAQGRMASFAPGGAAAQRIAKQQISVIVDDTLFVHGGVLPAYTKEMEDLNYQSRCFAAGKGEVPEGIIDSNGPLWTRAFSSDEPDCANLDVSLESLQIKRMVVGHTPQLKGITSACNERVWRVDTGMAEYYNGENQALNIEKIETNTVVSIIN